MLHKNILYFYLILIIFNNLKSPHIKKKSKKKLKHKPSKKK